MYKNLQKNYKNPVKKVVVRRMGIRYPTNPCNINYHICVYSDDNINIFSKLLKISF